MDFFFMALCGIALLVFRNRDRGLTPQGIIVPGDPWVTAAFVAVSFGIVAQAFYSSPRETAIGFAILASGAPVYLLWARRAPAKIAATGP
jgi:APA family basic amino acid/polyamine antiporter